MMRNRPLGCLAWVVFGSLVLSCVLPAPFELVTTLGLGWIVYLMRVVPQIKVSRDGVLTAAVCLALFTGGSHAFLRWLYREVAGPEAGPWKWQWTGSLVAGVVLMFTAGLAATGVVHQTGWMLASREPWLTDGSSAAARRMQSVNNLKQIGYAACNQYEGNNVFPPGLTMDAYGEPLHGWQTLILPWFEQPVIYNALNMDRPWDDPANARVLSRAVQTYLNPGVRERFDPAGWAPSHYEGNVRVLGGTRRFGIDDVTDGLGATIFSGEVAGGFQPWGKPGHWRDPADGLNRSAVKGFGGPYVGGASFLMMDGSVRFLKTTIDPAVFKALGTPAGGEAVPAEAY